MPRAPLFALALLFGSGCAASTDLGDPQAVEDARVPDDSDMSGEPSPGEWEAWLREAVAAAERDQPAVVAELRALAPAQTRDGQARFPGEPLARPGAGPVLLDRLARKTDPPPVRAALADALPRAGGPYAAALVGLFAREDDPEVRAAMIAALRRAAGEPAHAGLRAGLADADARVRTAAADTVSRRGDGAELADDLIAALDDPVADVQIAAARSLGALRVAAAFPALQARLAHESADVRLNLVRALGRIDRARAAALPELGRLAGDPDPRVARAATDLRAGASR